MERPDDFLGPDVFVSLQPVINRPLYLKCDGLNFGWSIKLRTAKSMIDCAEEMGRLRPGATIVESSSGNLGIAIALIAASRGYQFVCVVDPNCQRPAVALMTSMGARVEVVSGGGGESHLAARKARVRELVRRDSRTVWLNQYENPANPLAHYETTARAIDLEFPKLDVLFVGAGTGGTLMGCIRYFAENNSHARVVAVDSIGSVNFGGERADRHLTGLGASENMSLIDAGDVGEVEWVDERDTVLMCRAMARHGLVMGASSGTVVTGASAWLDRHERAGVATAVAVGPDTGLMYLDSIYDDAWCETTYPGLRDQLKNEDQERSG